MTRFDELFAGSDEDLFWGMIERIQDRHWSSEVVAKLPEEQAILVRAS